ncbi:MAG: CRISPR-associated helicase Cas3' [Desulfuromonadales bacterium]|nr:CRISPR-associated helicase Cas3' [Desulfuromonadales bacterium]
MEFWAKATPDGRPGISVYDHMVNVGCVARCIAESAPELLEHFNLSASKVGAFAALHDLGKISPGFQRKCQTWLEENKLAKIDRNACWDTSMEPDHGKVSHAAIQSFLLKNNVDGRTAKYLSTVLGAHHGRLSTPTDRVYRPIGAINDTYSMIDWDAERNTTAQKLWDFYVEEGTPFSITAESPSLWWLAGLTTVADWIGSDERFFPADNIPENQSEVARQALDSIGLCKTVFIRNLSFNDLFHDTEKPEIEWVPNEMQLKTLATITEPGIYVIEAPMGMGKTEAALWAAYQLLISGKATGIYFALPTQATSNRMHIRMNEFVRRISGAESSSRLIHGNSWLMEKNLPLSPVITNKDADSDDARAGRDWFSSAKRALIAPFGIGTVDQALLGVVAAKHFFVRHFALAGKVVILDEVHSYDVYTGRLIDKLISTLEGLGCTVIVLSATLTGKRRRQIVDSPAFSQDDAKQPYPLITGQISQQPCKSVSALPPESRAVQVDFVAASDAIEQAVSLARKGGSVLWICNTVGAAQQQFRLLDNLSQGEFPVGLLHSRFPFWRREQLERKWMACFGKDGKTRCASILVSTQVVEQSVDLDADLLITELAPTDMLLQRLGRLWRHSRENRPVDAPRICIIEEDESLEELRRIEPMAIMKVLGKKSKVYAPFVLLRTLELWKAQHGMVSIPAQIRSLIEETYNMDREEPPSWQKLYEEWFGTDSAKALIASRNSNIWQLALDDREGVQTRINEMPTFSLVLCRNFSRQNAVFIDGTTGFLGGETFCFPTAQAIHRNLVKVPRYCFEFVNPEPAFADYLYGEQCAGIVTECGNIEINGLNSGIKLSYSDELGLAVGKTS